MPFSTAPNAKLFGAHLAQTSAPNNPEALRGNHFAQMRAISALHLAHKWRVPLLEGTSGKPVGGVK